MSKDLFLFYSQKQTHFILREQVHLCSEKLICVFDERLCVFVKFGVFSAFFSPTFFPKLSILRLFCRSPMKSPFLKKFSSKAAISQATQQKSHIIGDFEKKKLVKKTPTFFTISRFNQKRIVVVRCLIGPVPL